MLLTRREKSLYCNSLVSILKGCEGKKTQIDLRNESYLIGYIECVHADMTIQMKQAKLTNLKGNQMELNQITIRGNNIRFVHIPDSVDMIDAMRRQINSIRQPYKKKDRKSKKVSNKT